MPAQLISQSVMHSTSSSVDYLLSISIYISHIYQETVYQSVIPIGGCEFLFIRVDLRWRAREERAVAPLAASSVVCLSNDVTRPRIVLACTVHLCVMIVKEIPGTRRVTVSD